MRSTRGLDHIMLEKFSLKTVLSLWERRIKYFKYFCSHHARRIQKRNNRAFRICGWVNLMITTMSSFTKSSAGFENVFYQQQESRELKRKACVLKSLRFEVHFRKALFSWQQDRVDGRLNGKNEAASVCTLPEGNIAKISTKCEVIHQRFMWI